MWRLLVIAGLLSWSHPATAQSDESLGTLRVKARPTGSAVYVDGFLVATSVSDLLEIVAPDLEPRSHLVKIELHGKQTWQDHIDVQPGADLHLDVELGNEQPWTSKFLIYSGGSIGLTFLGSGVALALTDDTDSTRTAFLISAGATTLAIVTVLHLLTRDTATRVELSASPAASD